MKAFGTLQSIRSPLRAVDGDGTYHRSISSILKQLSVCLYQRGVFFLFQPADPFIPDLPMTSSQ
jgi:hypothetical protein